MIRRIAVAATACALALSLAAPAPAAAGAAAPHAAADSSTSVDVLVAGAGTGGIAAAIQARRSGAGRVLLLEETDLIGGQIAAGVGTIDEGGLDRRAQRRSGLWSDIVSAFEAEYERFGWPHMSTCYGARRAGDGICVSPSIARRAYLSLLRAEGVELWTGASVVSVSRSGARVTGAVVDRGALGTVEVASTVLVDATEYGDVLALAGAAYRAGNGAVDPSSPSSRAAGAVQDITWPAVIRRYPRTEEGLRTVPGPLALLGAPFPTATDDPDPRATRASVLAWFSSQVDDRTGSSSSSAARPWTFFFHNQYRGLPDLSSAVPFTASDLASVTRTAINFANDYPNAAAGDPVDDMPVAYLEDPARRRDLECRAKLRTIQFVWFVQNVLRHTDWSVANDEGFATPYNRGPGMCPIIPAAYDGLQRNMPQRPYVRESRRGIGLATVAARDIYRAPHGGPTAAGGAPVTSTLAAPTDPRSALVGYYRIDLHGARSEELLERALETRDDWPPGSPVLPYGPYSIPVGAFIPRDLDGLLLAEKNISQTRSVNGASRLQPETTAGGQVAGTLAALAVRRGEDPRDLPVPDVQWELFREGAKLATNRFVDVPAGSTAERWADLAALWDVVPYERQTTLGRGSAALSRAAAAGVVRRAVRMAPAAPAPGRFSDWSPSSAHASDVEALAAAGVPVSCAPGQLCPSEPITRAQLAVWLVAAYDAVSGTRWAATYATQRAPLADVAIRQTRTSRSIYLVVDRTVGIAYRWFRPGATLTRYEALVWAPQIARWVDRGGRPPGGG